MSSTHQGPTTKTRSTTSQASSSRATSSRTSTGRATSQTTSTSVSPVLPINIPLFINPNARSSWWIASMSSILHLMRELHLDIPQDPVEEPKTFLDFLSQFYVATITENHPIVNLFPAIKLFIHENWS